MSHCPVDPADEGDPRRDESDAWLAALRGAPAERDDAVQRLHALLLRASRYQLSKMGEAHRLGEVRREELVQASADEAVVAVLARLDSFEGRSRFTTWAYKFAIFQTATTVRRESGGTVRSTWSRCPSRSRRRSSPPTMPRSAP